MSLDEGAGSRDEESSHASTVENEGRHSCSLVVEKYGLNGLFFSFLRCLVIGCVLGRRVRLAVDVSSDAIFDVPGVSQGEDGDSAVDASSSKAVHERTQHSRPAGGLEASVLHNDWEKG